MKLAAFFSALFLSAVGTAAESTANPFYNCVKACAIIHQGDNDAIDDCVSNCSPFEGKEGDSSTAFVSEASSGDLEEKAESSADPLVACVKACVIIHQGDNDAIDDCVANCTPFKYEEDSSTASVSEASASDIEDSTFEDSFAVTKDTAVTVSQSRSDCVAACDRTCQELDSDIPDDNCYVFRQICYYIVCDSNINAAQDVSEDAKDAKQKKLSALNAVAVSQSSSDCMAECDGFCQELGSGDPYDNCRGLCYSVICDSDKSTVQNINKDADETLAALSAVAVPNCMAECDEYCRELGSRIDNCRDRCYSTICSSDTDTVEDISESVAMLKELATLASVDVSRTIPDCMAQCDGLCQKAGSGNRYNHCRGLCYSNICDGYNDAVEDISGDAKDTNYAVVSQSIVQCTAECDWIADRFCQRPKHECVKWKTGCYEQCALSNNEIDGGNPLTVRPTSMAQEMAVAPSQNYSECYAECDRIFCEGFGSDCKDNVFRSFCYRKCSVGDMNTNVDNLREDSSTDVKDNSVARGSVALSQSRSECMAECDKSADMFCSGFASSRLCVNFYKTGCYNSCNASGGNTNEENLHQDSTTQLKDTSPVKVTPRKGLRGTSVSVGKDQNTDDDLLSKTCEELCEILANSFANGYTDCLSMCSDESDLNDAKVNLVAETM